MDQVFYVTWYYVHCASNNNAALMLEVICNEQLDSVFDFLWHIFGVSEACCKFDLYCIRSAVLQLRVCCVVFSYDAPGIGCSHYPIVVLRCKWLLHTVDIPILH